MRKQFFVLMTLLIPAITFAQPCTVNDATGCVCEDGSTDCYLLPNIKLSYDILVDPAENPESPGELRISVSTPNLGHGPLRVIATNDLVCGVDTFFNSTMTLCPDGSDPSQLVKQRIYRKQGNTMTYEDRWAGTMTYHPTHNHSHFDDWGVYSLRIPDPNEPNPLNWTMVGNGAKLGFCLMDFGTCQYYNGHCRDDNDNIITTNISNYGLGGGTYSCGVTNQGISVGWTDIYHHDLNGMFITIPDGVCNGDYMIVVQVDPNDVLLEENEDDNLIVAPITLTQQTDCCTDNSVTLNITLDDYPQETDWSIIDSSGDTLVSGSGYTASDSLITVDACVLNGCYDFIINDTYGDGICCGYGTGSYALTDATGNVLASGGQFTVSDSTNFCLNTSACAGIDLDINFDGNPEQTSWEITDANGNPVASSGGNIYSTALADSNLPLPDIACLPDGCYDLTFSDAANDGMCPRRRATVISNVGATGYGLGGVLNGIPRLADNNSSSNSSNTTASCGNYTLTDANGTVLATGGGRFGTSETNTFCVNGGVAAVAQPDVKWQLKKDNVNTDLQILPNLVENEMTVICSLKETANAELYIIDINGKILQQHTQNAIGTQQVRLNVSELASGFYFAKLVAGDVMMTKKFVKR